MRQISVRGESLFSFGFSLFVLGRGIITFGARYLDIRLIFGITSSSLIGSLQRSRLPNTRDHQVGNLRLLFVFIFFDITVVVLNQFDASRKCNIADRYTVARFLKINN